MCVIPTEESLTVEFKREWNEKKDGEPIKKTLIAFANTSGGNLYIGVDDDGTIVGISDASRLEEKLASTIRDTISPSLASFVTTQRLTVSGKTVLQVHVDEGAMKPYCLDPKTSSGVYIRCGNTSGPASMDDVARMVRENNPVPHESRIAFEQDLTFNECLTFCRERNVEFDPKLNAAYGFWDRKREAYTNLAWLCSDQSPAAVVMVNFRDNDKLIMADSARVTGSIFKLYNEATQFIARTNQSWVEKPSTGRAERIDHYIIDPRVILEALVNMIAHRDYSKQPPNIIHITPACIEMKSFGGLLDGLSVADIADLMATECRNAGLARLLQIVHLMENRGSGFSRIRAFYRQLQITDLLRVNDTSFTIRLPRLATDAYFEKPEYKDVVTYLATHGTSSRQSIQTALGLTQTVTIRLLKEMTKAELIKREGGSRSIRYLL